MTDVYTDKHRQQALVDLIERSTIDSALRERLLSDPHTTLKEETGVEPDEPVRFVEPGDAAGIEATSDGRTIVLPEAASTELSEDQLGSVSGGTSGGDIIDLLGLG